jgi:hypothetical protein
MRKADHLDDIEPVVAAGDDDAQLLNNAVIGNGGRVRQAKIDFSTPEFPFFRM